ncbi:hypothetical protein LF65_00084 [Clostridium beijerinckii]|uniref:Novel STAND NTPase 3 domain-containing protein n=1 Tax=Clostridium beijerinckii TaxID=1520 RepID=A0A0B5Q731_CLOBE|nr:hypothetical protein [Clostridium beijerinckii]AJG96775.1 hypothetical protein LF65_00084 [Clostridium beijerinckii]
MTDDEKARILIDEMRVHGAIVVLGAGASFEAGLPLYSQFPSMVWQTVDEFPVIKEKLKYSINMPAKNIIGEDVGKIKKSFEDIENEKGASLRFKELFKAVNDRHNNKISYVHESLCKLIHMGYVKLVISFNWDDLLECAWERLYGTNINSNKINLIKPHGDVRNINEKWIFPNSPGKLSAVELNLISDITRDEVGAFIILGYSEQDRVISDLLIQPNESRYKMYRIAPIPTAYISSKASDALHNMFKFIPNENTIWTKLKFHNQVGLEHAIMGYRLLPSDVVACARLPQIEEAKSKLEYAHSVVIQSEPGCGKSITAYQIAYDYLKSGWEIVKLTNAKASECFDIRLDNDGYKTIYIIDDAQQLENDLLTRIMTYANSYNKVIVTRTSTSDISEFDFEKVTISKKQSVQAIYEHYLKHEKEVLKIIKPLNKKIGRDIGNHYMDTPFKYVLDVALNENNPWLFNYSIRGGWANIKNQFIEAKENNRSDIVLVLIAVKQILMLDNPVDIEWLYSVVREWGYSTEWCNKTIQYLKNNKMILSVNEIRTLHLQAAGRIIANFLSEENEELNKFYNLLKKEMINEKTPFRGIAWFFDLLFGYDVKYKFYKSVFSEEFNQLMLDRCFSQNNLELKSDAARVIDRVLTRHGNLSYKDICKKYGATLKTWIEETENESSYPYSNILNSMINEDKKFKEQFVISLDIENVIHGMKKIRSENLYCWAQFLNRLSMGQSKQWHNKLFDILPKEQIHSALINAKISEIYEVVEMLSSLLIINEEYAYEEYYNCVPIIKKGLNHNFCDTLSQLDFMFLIYFLGGGVIDKVRLNNIQIEAGKTLMSCITPKMIADSITFGTPRDWENIYRFNYLLFSYDTEKVREGIDKVKIDEIDEKQQVEIWNHQSDELLKIIKIIGTYRKNDIDDWIFSHKDDIEELQSILISYSPKSAEYLLNKGKKIIIIDEHHRGWNDSVQALNVLNNYNNNLCKSVICQNKEQIERSLIKLDPIDWKDYYKFIKKLLAVDKKFMQDLFNSIDVMSISNNWKNKVYGKNYSHNRNKRATSNFVKLLKCIIKFTENKVLKDALENIMIDVSAM